MSKPWMLARMRETILRGRELAPAKAPPAPLNLDTTTNLSPKVVTNAALPAKEKKSS